MKKDRGTMSEMLVSSAFMTLLRHCEDMRVWERLTDGIGLLDCEIWITASVVEFPCKQLGP